MADASRDETRSRMMSARPGTYVLAVAWIAVGLFISGPLLAHIEWISPGLGFGLFLLGGGLGAVGIVMGLVSTWRHTNARRRPFMGLALASVPVLVLAALALTAPDVPPINDVTTDLEDPPQFVLGAGRPGLEGEDLSYPASFETPVREAYGELETATYERKVQEVRDAAVEVARSLGWQKVTPHYLGDDVWLVEAVDASWLFRFRDDVVVRIRELDGDGGVEVDVRSRSRVGRGDLGANAERIRTFMKALEDVLGGEQ